jgi:ribosome maturation protein Sdo1
MSKLTTGAHRGGRYALTNARNRVAALEFERDHQEQFNHRHPPESLDRAIDQARAVVDSMREAV